MNFYELFKIAKYSRIIGDVKEYFYGDIYDLKLHNIGKKILFTKESNSNIPKNLEKGRIYKEIIKEKIMNLDDKILDLNIKNESLNAKLIKKQMDYDNLAKAYSNLNTAYSNLNTAYSDLKKYVKSYEQERFLFYKLLRRKENE